MFSLLLSFIIDLYNLIPLTDKANMQGIYIIFCNNIDESEKNIPFGFPNIATKEDIV